MLKVLLYRLKFFLLLFIFCFKTHYRASTINFLVLSKLVKFLIFVKSIGDILRSFSHPALTARGVSIWILLLSQMELENPPNTFSKMMCLMDSKICPTCSLQKFYGRNCSKLVCLSLFIPSTILARAKPH